MSFVLHSQQHDCWCTGDFRSQCISRLGIGPQRRNIPSVAFEVITSMSAYTSIKVLNFNKSICKVSSCHLWCLPWNKMEGHVTKVDDVTTDSSNNWGKHSLEVHLSLVKESVTLQILFIGRNKRFFLDFDEFRMTFLVTSIVLTNTNLVLK